jgi:RNA polymerase sigma-70 factor (ECF subfamily)
VSRAPGNARPGYFIELTVENGKVRLIREFRYVPHLMKDAAVALP